VNGLTGEGAGELARFVQDAPEIESLNHAQIRFPLPQALCSYCLGETRIGPDYETNAVLHKKIEIPGKARALPSGEIGPKSGSL
jgi:hypothetical protein